MKKLVFTTKHWCLISGLICFIVCTFLLYFRPQESWCDDAFWADWAYRISQGGFVTYVWGGGQPSYSPLYAIIMAGWYKIIGFSYFAAQFPNLLFALFTYFLICFRINNGNLFTSKLAAVCFSICYWFADIFFWIYSCGRVDTLCLLFGILTIDSFIRAYETNDKKHIYWFCLWSMLEMATGFEGVIFTIIVLCIYSLINIKQSLKKWYLYVGYILSSCAAFIMALLYMAYHNCAKAFLRTTFGFSNSVKNIQHLITGGYYFENKNNLSLLERLSKFITVDFLTNKEYLVLILFVIILLLLSIYHKKWSSYSPTIKTLVISSIFIPWAFFIAGRYTIYYTWTGYIPACISVFFLIQDFKIEKWVASLLALATIVWFQVSPYHTDFKRIDFTHKIDKQNIEDIKQAQIEDDEPVYIPYKWYYYLAPRNKNLFFYWSWGQPKSMKKMIIDSNDVDDVRKDFEIEYCYSIGDRQVYKLIGDYGKNILLDR